VLSDQVRLLWMTPAQCPSGLPTAVGDDTVRQPPTMFYRTACIDERHRSSPGPMRRPLVVPWKLRHLQATYSIRRRHQAGAAKTVNEKFKMS
jgi:hypothetical protein